MAPPRRKPLDPSNAPKHIKKSKAPKYETFEEALDYGVELEEKGERYKTGEKAKRFYEEACKLYEKAIEFDPQAFEGHYNLARTLYTISQIFLLPPLSSNTLEMAINQYRLSQKLTESPILWIDATFNLAVALLSLADLVEDLQEADEQDAEVESLRREAAGWLTSVAEKQEGLLEEMERQNASVGEQESILDIGEEPEEDIDKHDHSPDQDEVQAENGSGRAWEETVTTPSLVLDTYILLLSTLSLLSKDFSASRPSPSALPEIPPIFQKFRVLDSLCARSGAPRTLDILVAEASAKLSVIRSAFEDGRPGWMEECRMVIATLKSSWESIKDIDAPGSSTHNTPRIDQETRISVVCTLGDAYALLAQLQRLSALQILLQTQTAPMIEQVQEIWTTLSLSTQCSSTALSILTPSQQAFPSTMPNRGESSSVLLALASLSLQRAVLADEPWRNASAIKNKAQLITNSITYSRRAAESSGTGWQTALAPWPSVMGWQSRPSWVDGGWEAEQTAREAILSNIRSQFYKAAPEALQEVEKTLLRVKNRLQPTDVRRFVKELIEDHGILRGGSGGEEEQFWENVINVL
ncbi:Tetratricopeptide-like helical [Phaffia rhodozyma]|uniref:Tetratricopeptide-like helical n=1 Tax=Phaffia rhodozyma TaxID=264483 RepID=A0A0F7SSM0_PHARH|nr:Tetratricopeptide-like helical [Phaffia rhodozyma]